MLTKVAVKYLLLFILLSVVAQDAFAGGDKSVIVYLIDGSQVEGDILQFTVDFVKLDPVGAISLRTIYSKDIERVEFTQSDKIYTFPIDESQLPGDLSKDPREKQSRRSNGVGPIRFVAAGGYAITTGPYYEGIGSGPAFQLGSYYHFSQDNPYGPAFFIGFSYKYNNPGFDDDIIYLDYNAYVEYEKCVIHQFNLEFGVNGKVSNSDSYIYLLSGLSIVQNQITGHAVIDQIAGPSTTYSESAAAFRFYCGGVIGINAKIGLDIHAGVDFLITKKESSYNYYSGYYDNTDVVGTLIGLGMGLVFEP